MVFRTCLDGCGLPYLLTRLAPTPFQVRVIEKKPDKLASGSMQGLEGGQL